VYGGSILYSARLRELIGYCCLLSVQFSASDSSAQHRLYRRRHVQRDDTREHPKYSVMIMLHHDSADREMRGPATRHSDTDTVPLHEEHRRNEYTTEVTTTWRRDEHTCNGH